jgi:predicted DNA-binding protein YlxM (UPF0122 family)
MKQSDHKEWYSATEIAKIKGMTRSNVHLIIKKKEVKTMKIGNSLGIPHSELYKFDTR